MSNNEFALASMEQMFTEFEKKKSFFYNEKYFVYCEKILIRILGSKLIKEITSTISGFKRQEEIAVFEYAFINYFQKYSIRPSDLLKKINDAKKQNIHNK
jgi:hypothetical protein